MLIKSISAFCEAGWLQAEEPQRQVSALNSLQLGKISHCGGKRECIQTSQGQVRAIVLYLRGEGNERGMARSLCNAMEELSRPRRHRSVGPQALPIAGHGFC